MGHYFNRQSNSGMYTTGGFCVI